VQPLALIAPFPEIAPTERKPLTHAGADIRSARPSFPAAATITAPRLRMAWPALARA